jgi:hypothetical protein
MFVAWARPETDYHAVKTLLATGLSDYEVGRRLDIPRSTVLNYRRRTAPPKRPSSPATVAKNWRPPDRERYCYLLGLYLGDGCLIDPPRGNLRLTLTLDAAYPALIEEASNAITAIAPDVHVCTAARPGCVALIAGHPCWHRAFPQHGRGRKHKRKIELAGWQRRLTRKNPRALLRGLIHSDGSRVLNRFTTELPSGRIADYQYVRYFFTNYSADIRGIFCEHCDLLGIRWTQSSYKNISIANRPSVALLDEFVGPKK